MIVYDILQFLESQELYNFLFPWRILFIVITIFFIFAIFYYSIKLDLLKESKRRIKDFLSFQKFNSTAIFAKRCKKISTFLNKKDYKKAILMMEELLVDVLISKGVIGENLIEMIEKSEISDIPKIKEIYAIAEEIKEGQGYILNINELQELFDSCEEALKRLNIIT